MFTWYQCQETTCLFRCPALPTELSNNQCPNCKGTMLPNQTIDLLGHITEQAPSPQTGAVGLLLDNIRSIYNVGALFRTADGAQVSHLFCCGMTATPDHPKVAKTALGAETAQVWQYSTNSLFTAVSLQKQGWQIWAIEKTETAVSLFDIERDTAVPIILVAGNERAGVDPAILSLADRVVSLPMMGKKESLNVAVASGIVIYSLKFGK